MAKASDRSWMEVMWRFKFAAQVMLCGALLGWIGWFWPYDDWVDRSGTPLGADYVMLYVAGQVVAEGQADQLYNDALNQQRSSRLFEGLNPNESWPYRYPPTVAAAMVPLSMFPIQWSFLVFVTIQLTLLAITLRCFYVNFPVLHRHSGWLWVVVGSPLVLETIIGGQSSLLGLACLTGFVHFWRRNNDGLAGAILALTLYKPNVAALLIVAALIVRPRLLVGFLPMAGLGLLVSISTAGLSGVVDYVQLATQLASSAWSLETPYWKVHGLAPWFQWCSPSHGKLLCALTGLTLSLAIAVLWKARGLTDNLAWALLLCCSALFNPYVPIYDLVLLELALILFCQSAWDVQWKFISPLALQGMVALVFVGPHLSQSIARPLGWQPFPWLLLGVLATVYAQYRLSNWRCAEGRTSTSTKMLSIRGSGSVK